MFPKLPMPPCAVALKLGHGSRRACANSESPTRSKCCRQNLGAGGKIPLPKPSLLQQPLARGPRIRARRPQAPLLGPLLFGCISVVYRFYMRSTAVTHWYHIRLGLVDGQGAPGGVRWSILRPRPERCACFVGRLGEASRFAQGLRNPHRIRRRPTRLCFANQTPIW